MKLKAQDIDLDTDFSHYSDYDRLHCEQLQAKAGELLALDPARYENRHPDVLLNAAAAALVTSGNQEMYSGIYACETCGQLYHGDYSINSDPRHDYCGGDTH